MYEIFVGRTKEDKEKYDSEGMILLGKHYVTMGQTTSLSNPVLMDVSTSHVVFVTGKRGSGKCVSGDTLIALGDGRLLPIAKLAQDSTPIVSLNNELKTQKSQKSHFYTRTANKLLKITLRSGKIIKLTPEHPLLSVRGWKPACHYVEGQHIATPRKLPNFGSAELPEHEILLLAYFIAEGHTGTSILFSNTDPDIVREFTEATKQLDTNTEVAKLKPGDYRVYTRNFTSRIVTSTRSSGPFMHGVQRTKTPIRSFLEKYELKDKSSYQKTIPQNILQLKKPLLSLFLSRLFSCDGSLYRKKCRETYVWQISYATVNRTLAEQVHHLLLRYDILSRIRTKTNHLNGKEFTSYELVIGTENVVTFIDQIGFFGRKTALQHTAMRETFLTKRNPNVDLIPKELWNGFKAKNWAAIGRALQYRHPKAARETVHYATSRQKLLQIAFVEQNEYFKQLAASDIFWDEIVSIETLNGSFEVYDLSVPEYHNFVANDVIVHNSYSMMAMAEAMMDLPQANRLSIVMFDTMGIYWTMKYENKKDEDLLKEWGLRSHPVASRILIPAGHFEKAQEDGIPIDGSFSIQPRELSITDWCTTFNLEITSPIGALIGRTLEDLGEKNYDVDDIIDTLKSDERIDEYTKAAAENLFLTAKSWGLFDKQGVAFADLVRPGEITVLDVSPYTSGSHKTSVRALVIGLISKKLFQHRMDARKKEEFESVKSFSRLSPGKQEQPLIWIMVDEAHEFLPKEGETAASDALITLLREGRQPGISLVLASQQPGQIHTDVMTQSDIVLAHHITAKADVDALGALMQTYMREGLDVALSQLPDAPGAALVFDDTNERLYPIRVRPRITWHGGSSPSLLEAREFTFE